MRRGRFRWDVFAVAAVAAALLHFYALIPWLLMPLLQKHEPAPMEVAYLEDTPSSETAPPIEPPSPNPESAERDKKSATDRQKSKPESVKEKKEREKLAEKKFPPPPEVAKVEPPKPKPKPVEVVKAPPPLPPPPPPPAMPHMKMVDQDKFKEEKENLDAKYLAQKNHRAAKDTQGKTSNLVREMPGPQEAPNSAPSENKSADVGEKDRKIAELEERKGREHEIVRSKPQQGDRGTAGKSGKPGALSMRNLTPKAAEKVDGTTPREGLELLETEKGPLPQARVGDGGARAQAEKRGSPQVRLQLDAHDYDRIEGESVAETERRDGARAERSHGQGRWDRVNRKLAMMRSSLENFTPDVKPGNQAELGTRAHPFAAFIATMHRSIHKLWAFGFLAELDGKSPSSEFNDMSLWTQLEIVLKQSGEVEKVTIVRPSGNAGFDAAAIDSVMSASPFPKPPDSIRSANGKVYLDWRFHRDDRQCATDFVDPHILTTVAPNEDHDTQDLGRAPTVAPPRVLRRNNQAAPVEESAPVAAAAPTASGDGTPVPDAARDAAQGWFASYVRGDAGWLAGWSAAPFSAGGEVVAKDGAAVKKLYADLLREAPTSADGRRLDKFDVLTAGGARAKLGGLPPGGEGDGSMFFAVGEVGREHFVLLLKKSDQGWRVAGLDR